MSTKITVKQVRIPKEKKRLFTLGNGQVHCVRLCDRIEYMLRGDIKQQTKATGKRPSITRTIEWCIEKALLNK